MARKRVCKKNTDGFVSSYAFDTDGLNVLELPDGNHTVLNRIALPLRSLNKALTLGKPGEQTVVISQKGFDRLSFINAYPAGRSVCYPKFLDRGTKARET